MPRHGRSHFDCHFLCCPNGCLQQIAAKGFSTPQDVIAILLQGLVSCLPVWRNTPYDHRTADSSLIPTRIQNGSQHAARWRRQIDWPCNCERGARLLLQLVLLQFINSSPGRPSSGRSIATATTFYSHAWLSQAGGRRPWLTQRLAADSSRSAVVASLRQAGIWQ